MSAILEKADELWHWQKEPWATIRGWHYPVQSDAFRHWVVGEQHAQQQSIGKNKITELVSVFAADALFKGAEHRVHLRTAQHDGVIWLDFADKRGRAVRIDGSDWRIVTAPACPVKFYRPPN